MVVTSLSLPIRNLHRSSGSRAADSVLQPGEALKLCLSLGSGLSEDHRKIEQKYVSIKFAIFNDAPHTKSNPVTL